MKKSKSLSFCSTCRNRLWQLKETLSKNLGLINDESEIILVDYGSTDGLSEWVWSHHKSDIESGKLVFFEVKNPVSWNVARAKNLAHRLASGRYLFNLDADNFITSLTIQQIEKAMQLNLACWQFSQSSGDGSYGRIGLPSALFWEIGGYDESLLPMGAQDFDILLRIENLGVRILSCIDSELKAIPNSINDKVKEMSQTPLSLTDTRELHQILLALRLASLFSRLKSENPIKVLTGIIYRRLGRRAKNQTGKNPSGIKSTTHGAETLYAVSNNLSVLISKFKLKTEGPVRLGGGFSYIGILNGEKVTINGFDSVSRHSG